MRSSREAITDRIRCILLFARPLYYSGSPPCNANIGGGAAHFRLKHISLRWLDARMGPIDFKAALDAEQHCPLRYDLPLQVYLCSARLELDIGVHDLRKATVNN